MPKCLGVVVLLVALGLPLLAVELPPITSGVINGQVAVLLWPRRGDQALDPSGCTAHLVTRQNAETTHACGEWFLPPSGVFRVWLENSTLISPHPTLLVYNGGPFKGKGLGAVMDMVPAGRVQAPSPPPDAHVLLVHLDSHRRGRSVQRLLERQVGSSARNEVLMPLGRVLAVLLNADGDASAVSRPIEVVGGVTAKPALSPPKSGADLFVTLDRPRIVSPAFPDTVALALAADGRELPPDVTIDGADRIYAVWYGLQPGTGSLRATSPTLTLPETPVRMTEGHVANVRSGLRLLPKLHVRIEVPTGTDVPSSGKVEIFAESQGLVRTASLDHGSADIDSLPPEPLRCVLHIERWRFTRSVDLSSFHDEDLVFDLKPIVVNGTVRRGGNAIASELRFYTGDDWEKTSSGDDGKYEITLWEPRTYAVEIQPKEDDGAAPYREYFVDLPNSETKDFSIPDTHFTVLVADRNTGRGIGNAVVGVRNTFFAEGVEQNAAQRVVTADDGRTRLPPLRAGSADLLASAKGYRDKRSQFSVSDERATGEIQVMLEQEGADDELHLLLPGGAPAAGANVLAVGGDSTVLWRDTTDGDGVTHVPRRVEGAIVVAGASEGLLVRAWHVPESEVTWRMSPPGLLRLRTVDRGGTAVSYANLIFWIDGNLLSGEALRLITGAAPISDASGFWAGHAIIEGRTEVVAVPRLSTPIVRTAARSVQPAEQTVDIPILP